MTADQPHGEFRGLIMQKGDSTLLDKGASLDAHGCANCTWTLLTACATNDPGVSEATCTTAILPHCKGVATRVFVTDPDAGVTNESVGVICIGPADPVVPVSAIAATNVADYLKNVAPPNADLTLDPSNGTPAGLPTYFTVHIATPPPVAFGGGQVRENITLTPQAYDWAWGDGGDSGWTTDTGGPYPSGTLTHTYVYAGHVAGTLSTRWSATYTVTVGGRTLGPFNAVGTITKSEPFAVLVLSQHSTLVSHG